MVSDAILTHVPTASLRLESLENSNGQNRKKMNLKRRKTAKIGGFSKKGGPSDRIRTCGILLPKQARYQLRYTRILGGFSQSWRATNCATPGYDVTCDIIIYAGKDCKGRFICGMIASAR